MKRIRVTDTGEREDRGASTILAVVLMMILYATVLMWGQMLLTSVIEEKTSRVVEVMASAVPPVHLLVGKLLGVGAAGMTQFLVWALSLFAVSLGGAGMMVAMGGGKLPEISLLLLVGLVVYFVLGFLLYSAMFAAVGASVNTSQEAQGLAFPVMMPLIASVMMFPMVMQGPGQPPLGRAVAHPVLHSPPHVPPHRGAHARRCGRSPSPSCSPVSPSPACSGSPRASTASES